MKKSRFLEEYMIYIYNHILDYNKKKHSDYTNYIRQYIICITIL